jgi:2-dehydro-3-deoxyphosphogluconate aldolase/(4S)-4-hydroxy-2-oxoglutarate aldolase
MRPPLPGRITDERLIPVARGLDSTSAPRLALALLDGGVSTIEVTLEGPAGMDALEALQDVDITVGAGTIVTLDQGRSAVAAGAEFLVSPHLVTDLADWSKAREIPYIPGALTPTEIAIAWRCEPAAVKIFPAHVGGPSYVRSLLGPYPDVVLIPTGGVDSANASGFIEAGAVAVGVGGWLTSHSDLSVVTERTREVLGQVV